MLVPPGVESTTRPVFAPTGTTTTTVDVATEEIVAITPPNLTTVVSDKLVPVIITASPTYPLGVEIDVIFGATKTGAVTIWHEFKEMVVPLEALSGHVLPEPEVTI